MSISIPRAEKVLRQMRRCRVLVVGDLMLDRYLYGDVSRISPEAPVPVVEVKRETSMPGGASNVAWNIQSLGGQAAVAGVLGPDHAGRDLRAVLDQGGVQVRGALPFQGVRTIVKMRIIAERQQVVRVDFEDRIKYPAALVRRFCSRLRAEIQQADGVIIEDYGKGVISQEVVDTIMAAAGGRIPVGLDPKDNHELCINGITVATPNRKEAFTIAGVKDHGPHPQPLEDEPLRQVGECLLKKWQAQQLAITLGPLGMYLVSRTAPPRHVPTRAIEVFDVSGAGDTVIAACVTALAAGASFVEAAELSNYAAGVVVGKLGTATCTPAELIAHMRKV